jgi:hypothetical protein
MTVTNQNFRIYRGDTHTIDVNLTQADDSPYDPTLVMKFKRYAQATALDVDRPSRSIVSGLLNAPCGQLRPAGIVVINRVKPIFVTAEAPRIPRSSIRTQRFSAEAAASIDQFRQR